VDNLYTKKACTLVPQFVVLALCWDLVWPCLVATTRPARVPTHEDGDKDALLGADVTREASLF
jgi:hypothetical protein